MREIVGGADLDVASDLAPEEEAKMLEEVRGGAGRTAEAAASPAGEEVVRVRLGWAWAAVAGRGQDTHLQVRGSASASSR